MKCMKCLWQFIKTAINRVCIHFLITWKGGLATIKCVLENWSFPWIGCPRIHKRSFLVRCSLYQGWTWSPSWPLVFEAMHSQYACEFWDTIHSYGCENIVHQPTRVSPDTESLLYPCITNFSPHDSSSGVISCDLSEHLPVFSFFPFVNLNKQRN